MRPSLALLLAPALALAACSGSKDAGEKANETAVETANLLPRVEKIDDPSLLKSAFAAAYKTPEVRLGDDLYQFRPAALYRVNGGWVLLSEGNGPDCHACSGFLGVHYLAGDPAALRVTAGQPDAIPGSSFGAPPQWQLRTDLMAAPVIEAEGGGTWQGITCSTATLTELAPGGPALRAKGIPLLYDDSGMVIDGKATSVKGAVTAKGERGRSFTVDYGGSVDREIVYTRQGDTYAPAGKTDDLPAC